MDPVKPPVVVEAETRISEFNRQVLVPFLAWSVLGGGLGVPLGIGLGSELLGPQLAVAGTLVVFLGGLFAMLPRLIRRASAIAWTRQVMLQWQVTKAGKQLPDASHESPEIVAARTMAGRIHALLPTDRKAEAAADLAVERAIALMEERQAVATSLSALDPGGEGARALEQTAAALDQQVQHVLGELASLYAALATEQAGAPQGSGATPGDAIDKIEALPKWPRRG